MGKIKEFNLIRHNHRMRQMGYRPKPYCSSALKKFRGIKPLVNASGAVINFNEQTTEDELTAIYAIHKFTRNWTGSILIEPNQELFKELILANPLYHGENLNKYDKLLINELPAEFSKYLDTSDPKCTGEEQVEGLNVLGINLLPEMYTLFIKKIDELIPYLKKAKRVIRFKPVPSVELWRAWWKGIYLDESKQEAWYRQYEAEQEPGRKQFKPILQKLRGYTDKELLEHLEGYIKRCVSSALNNFEADIVSEIRDKLLTRFDLSAAPLVLNRYIEKSAESLNPKVRATSNIEDEEVLNRYIEESAEDSPKSRHSMGEIENKELFTVKEVAVHLDIKEQRIYELIVGGIILPIEHEAVVIRGKRSHRYKLNRENIEGINSYIKDRKTRRYFYSAIVEKQGYSLRHARRLVKKQLDKGMTFPEIYEEYWGHINDE